MSIALFTLILLGVIFFIWRNFMKNKEYTITIVEHLANKHNIEILDDTVCLRKLRIKREGGVVFYRVYSFDYNTVVSDTRYRAYIVLRNGKFDELIMSEFEKADLEQETATTKQYGETKRSPANNVINFEE